MHTIIIAEVILMCVLPIGLSSAISTSGPIVAELIDYLNEPIFDGKVCETSDVVFKIPNKTLHRCAMACAKSARCQAFTFSATDKSCFGCRFEYGLGKDLQSGVGTKYYKAEWYRLHNHAFKVSTHQMPFDEVESYCNEFGAFPARIDSQEKSDFIEVSKLPYPNLWLGLTDKVQAGLWRWVRGGEVVNFTDWYLGQPANSQTVDCAIIKKSRNYRWVDRDCSNPMYALCEKYIIRHGCVII